MRADSVEVINLSKLFWKEGVNLSLADAGTRYGTL